MEKRFHRYTNKHAVYIYAAYRNSKNNVKTRVQLELNAM